MFIYLFLFILIVFAAINDKNDKNKVLAHIVIGLFILLVGLRAVEVGTDTSNYTYSYSYSMNERVEPFFYFLRNVCRFLGFSVNIYFIIIACLTFIPLWIIIKKESINIGYSLLIYYTFSELFFFQNFNVVRACLAISYIFLSCHYLQRNQLKSAFFFCFVAVMFHYSALMIVVIILLDYYIKSFNFVCVLSGIVLSVVLGFLLEDFIKNVVYDISSMEFILFNDSDTIDNYSRYLNDFDNSSWNLVGILATILPFSVLSILIYDKTNSKNIYYHLFVYGVIINNIFISALFTYRITMYLLIPIILILPNTYMRLSIRRKYMVLCITSFMCLWFVYKLLTASSDSFCESFPYKFYFE